MADAHATPTRILVRPNGTIVVAGALLDDAQGGAMAALRLQANGALDPSFGLGGRIVMHSADGDLGAQGAAFDPQGRLMLAGTFHYLIGNSGYDRLAVGRLTPAGLPDLSWSNASPGPGVRAYTAGIGSSYSFGEGIAVDATGRPIMAVSAAVNTTPVAHIVRLSNTGVVQVKTALAGFGQSAAVDIALDSAARPIVLARNGTGYADIGLLRFKADLTGPDTTYDGDGYASRSVGQTLQGFERAGTVAFTGGRIVSAFVARNGSQRVVGAVGHGAGGALDPAFGSAGATAFALTAPGFPALSAYADGRLALGTEVTVGMGQHFAAMRLTAAGLPDNTFSGDGLNTAPIGDGTKDVTGRAVLGMADGGMLVAGSAGLGGVNARAVARFGPGGDLDGGFASGGKFLAVLGISGSGVSALGQQSSGRILLAGGGRQPGRRRGRCRLGADARRARRPRLRRRRGAHGEGRQRPFWAPRSTTRPCCRTTASSSPAAPSACRRSCASTPPAPRTPASARRASPSRRSRARRASTRSSRSRTAAC